MAGLYSTPGFLATDCIQTDLHVCHFGDAPVAAALDARSHRLAQTCFQERVGVCAHDVSGVYHLFTNVQAIHIGDSLMADVQGALNAKLAAAILVNRRHKVLPQGGPYPTHIVEHVTELPRILEALQATNPVEVAQEMS